MNTTHVMIKLGGSVLEECNLINNIAAELYAIKSSGISIVVVHGGGKAINTELKINNIESTFYDGLRITTPEMMKIINTALCEKINKKLVDAFCKAGLPAEGMSGADNQMLQCTPFSAIHNRVGRIIATKTEAINLKKIPVISSVGIDAQNELLNVNADWAASCLALALKVNKLIFITDQDGIYDYAGNLISELDYAGLEQLIQTKMVKDGMLTKVKAIQHALKYGINHIRIINGKKDRTLLNTLINEKKIGTAIQQTIGSYQAPVIEKEIEA